LADHLNLLPIRADSKDHQFSPSVLLLPRLWRPAIYRPSCIEQKTLMQFRFRGKRAANIEGINLKGLKNSLEKALTYAHITTR
jgi:hypothetical protein